MEHFSYSLLLSLMHSLWQAALLLCFYFVAGLVIKRPNPLSKRNILFLLLATQFFLTISTFFIYYSGSAFYYLEYIDSNLSGFIVNQSYLEIMAPWFIAVYIFVIAFKIINLAFNWRRFKIAGRTAWIKPSIDLKLFTKIKADQFGIRRKINLWYSNAIETPLTFGFFKPVILLPVALVNNLSIAETEALIIHELTHIKSNDYFFNWILITCETIFFFNPFIRIITSKVKMEREKNCDASVLQFNYPALSYAETLLKTARFKSSPAPFFLAAVFKNAQLIKRIRFFTEEKNLRFYKRNYNAAAFFPIMGIFILSIFIVNFIKNKKDQPVEAQTVSLLNATSKENPSTFFTTNSPVVKKEEEAVAKENNIAPGQETEIKSNNNNLGRSVKAFAESQALLSDEPELESLATPVVLAEQNNTKEIILKDENSATGKTTTKVYQMRFENGEWKTTLLWTITESRPLSDSLPYFRDTTSKFLNEAQ